MTKIKNNTLCFIAILFGLLLLGEAVLRISLLVYEKRLRAKAIPLMIKDKVLEHRPNPKYPGHDEKGFRNQYVPQEAAVVAMGDSQTYGVGVHREQAWPQQMEKIGGAKAYNMAFGGYGPAHSLLLLDEALELKPKLIIEAFYFGNDLYDSYHLVYDLKQLSGLNAADKRIIEDINIAERIEPLEEKITVLFKMGGSHRKRGSIANHSKLYLFLNTIIQAVKRRIAKKREGGHVSGWELIKNYALDRKDYLQIVDAEKVKTVLTPNYRLCALDINDPRIKEGFRISLEAIRLINDRLKARGIDFMVLLIPTKESVLRDAVYQYPKDMPAAYEKLINSEGLARQKTIDFLKVEGIDFIDALPALKECVSGGRQPYQISWDGHPSVIGQRAIAESVLAGIREREKYKP